RRTSTANAAWSSSAAKRRSSSRSLTADGSPSATVRMVLRNSAVVWLAMPGLPTPTKPPPPSCAPAGPRLHPGDQVFVGSVSLRWERLPVNVRRFPAGGASHPLDAGQFSGCPACPLAEKPRARGTPFGTVCHMPSEQDLFLSPLPSYRRKV